MLPKILQHISNLYLTEKLAKKKNAKNKFYNKHCLSSTTIHSVVDIKKIHLSSFYMDFFLFKHTLISLSVHCFEEQGILKVAAG